MTLTLPVFLVSIFSFFLESSTLFQRLAILLVTSFLPPFLPLVAADSETVSEMSCDLAGADFCLWISILLGDRLPNFEALFKLWLEGEVLTKLVLVGLGILLQKKETYV